jgi:putative nucleotidyltransferase with HDIG domain
MRSPVRGSGQGERLDLTTYEVIPLVEVAFCLILLALLVVRGKRHVAQKPFFLFLVSMTLWGIFIYLMRRDPDLARALLWEKLVFVAIFSASILFYRFTIGLTGAAPRRWIHYLPLALYFTCLALIPTQLMVTGMQVMWYGKAPIVGPLFPAYVASVYVPLTLGLVTLIKHGKRSHNVDEKIRLQYIVAGIIAVFIGGTTDYLPVLGVSMYPLGIVGNILFCVLATVAMLRYDLLEMKFIIRRGISYSLVGILILSIFAGLTLLLSSVFQTAVSPISITITIVSVLIALLVFTFFQPVLPLFQRMVDRWFYRERYDHLQTLKRFTKETRDMIDLKQLGSSLVTAIANGMQSRYVYLLLPSPQTGNFVTHSYYGQNPTGHLSLPASSLLALAMRYEDGPVHVNDIEVLPALKGLANGEKDTLVKNQIEILVPLKTRETLVGMLLIGGKLSGEHYTGEDRQLLHKISQEVAVSIENAIAYDSIQQEHGELMEAMEGIIHAMSLVVEARDPYTAGHQKRVADIACAIARAMDLSEWTIRGIRVAGLLHDVGKLSVPAEILTKPGKLNASEFSIIKSHSQVSYDILELIEFPWAVKPAILQHHERLDGSGYPEGLSGDDIILEARILGVADVVEAISSHRPYRPALGLEFAMREIIKNKDVLYDARVVDACLKLFEEKDAELEQLLLPVAAGA